MIHDAPVRRRGLGWTDGSGAMWPDPPAPPRTSYSCGTLPCIPGLNIPDATGRVTNPILVDASGRIVSPPPVQLGAALIVASGTTLPTPTPSSWNPSAGSGYNPFAQRATGPPPPSSPASSPTGELITLAWFAGAAVLAYQFIRKR